jgi:hypothetical protein
MNPLSSLLQGPSYVDPFMERAHALKHEEQIYPDEIKYLISKLDASLQQAQGVGKRRKIPGSRYAPSEVTRQVNALRSMLLAMEIIKRSQENGEGSAGLRARARNQLLQAFIEL